MWIIWGNALKFEYLGEFEDKIENTSGAQLGSLGQNPVKNKISYKCTFKPYPKAPAVVLAVVGKLLLKSS